MMRRRSSSSNSSVEAREGASVAVWASPKFPLVGRV